MYIIVFQHGYRDPHLALDSHYHLETFSTYEEAKAEAERCKDDEWYYDYVIYKEANS